MRTRRLTILLTCLALAFAGTLALAGDSADEGPGTEKRIKMTAQNWKWIPDVIRVKKGTKLTIEFQSYDASHSFVLKAYKIKHPLPEGSRSEISFVVDKAGEFPWKCGRPCGDGCPKMRGRLIVEE